MAAKKFSGNNGLVYSTNKTLMDTKSETEQENVPVGNQKLKVTLDTKQRAGKAMTMVSGFEGPDNALTALGKELKNKCGTGGSVKDGLIMIQGDNREKVIAHLKSQGYNVK